jgi:hypothetical protein
MALMLNQLQVDRLRTVENRSSGSLCTAAEQLHAGQLVLLMKSQTEYSVKQVTNAFGPTGAHHAAFAGQGGVYVGTVQWGLLPATRDDAFKSAIDGAACCPPASVLPLPGQVQLPEGIEMLRKSAKAAACAVEPVIRGIKTTGIGLLGVLKFLPVGLHPATHEPCNVIEQINQTFTCLVVAEALEELQRLHPTISTYDICLAERGGIDIKSAGSKEVAAECFAATHLASNAKLSEDVEKLQTIDAKARYVFAYCPGLPKGVIGQSHGVLVWSVGLHRYC